MWCITGIGPHDLGSHFDRQRCRLKSILPIRLNHLDIGNDRRWRRCRAGRGSRCGWRSSWSRTRGSPTTGRQNKAGEYCQCRDDPEKSQALGIRMFPHQKRPPLLYYEVSSRSTPLFRVGGSIKDYARRLQEGLSLLSINEPVGFPSRRCSLCASDAGPRYSESYESGHASSLRTCGHPSQSIGRHGAILHW